MFKTVKVTAAENGRQKAASLPEISPQMFADLPLLLTLAAVVLVLTVFTETAARRQWAPQWLCRKVLHVGAVGACAVAPLWVRDLTGLTGVVAFAEPLLFYLVATGRLFSEDDGRKSWGIALFPLAYLILLLLVPEHRWLIALSMGILALSDAAAAVAGTLLAQRRYQLTGDAKSVVGNAAFFGCTFGLLLTYFPGETSLPDYTWAVLAFVALLLTVLEALGSNGFDNLLVPLGAAALLYHLPDTPASALTLWAGVLAATIFGVWTVRRGSLSPDGAVTAALLGLWVWYFAGALWLLPLFVFFLTSTLLGKLAKRRNSQATDAKHGQARDWKQVICNGGVYALLAAGAPTEAVFPAMLASLAVSTADTWASEIGIFFGRPTFDVLRWRRTPVGLSGGVSGPGTLGGLLGAAALAGSGAWLLPGGNWLFAAALTLAGFVGMLLDSLLGAGLQARYRNSQTGLLSDEPTAGAQLFSGLVWISNDAVNLLSNVLVVLVWLLFWG